MKTATPPYQKLLPLILGGLAAGFVNGLLGAGGGILLVFLLDRLFSGGDMTEKDTFANALAIMLPVSAVSALSYAARGGLAFAQAESFILPAVIGGAAGAFLLDRLKIGAVKRIFSLLIIYSGIAMLVR